MLQAAVFLPSLLLLVPQTFQVQNQHQRESRRFHFDQQILKRLSSRNLEGFKDMEGVTEKDGVAYQDENGLDKRIRKNAGGRKPQGRGGIPRENLSLNQFSRRGRADGARSQRLGARKSALQHKIPGHFYPSTPPAGYHLYHFTIVGWMSKPRCTSPRSWKWISEEKVAYGCQLMVVSF